MADGLKIEGLAPGLARPCNNPRSRSTMYVHYTGLTCASLTLAARPIVYMWRLLSLRSPPSSLPSLLAPHSHRPIFKVSSILRGKYDKMDVSLNHWWHNSQRPCPGLARPCNNTGSNSTMYVHYTGSHMHFADVCCTTHSLRMAFSPLDHFYSFTTSLATPTLTQTRFSRSL